MYIFKALASDWFFVLADTQSSAWYRNQNQEGKKSYLNTTTVNERDAYLIH